MDISSVKLITLDGKEILNIDTAKDIALSEDKIIEECIVDKKFLRPIDWGARLSCEFDIKNSHINKEMLNSLKSSPKDFTMTFSTPFAEQIRKHKKYRINKKWLKKYGVKINFFNEEVNINKFNQNLDEISFDLDYKNFMKHHSAIKLYKYALENNIPIY